MTTEDQGTGGLSSRYPTLTRDRISTDHFIVYVQGPDAPHASIVIILRDADFLEMGWAFLKYEVLKHGQGHRVPVTNCTVWAERC